jgi:hypothetical protein
MATSQKRIAKAKPTAPKGKGARVVVFGADMDTKPQPKPKAAPKATKAKTQPKPKAEPAKLGRPSKYTPELAREICIRMAGGETLRQVCRDDHMPAASTVRGWVVDNVDGFSEHYTRARTLLAEHWADEILEIADGSVERTMEGRLDGADVQQKRLQVDSRKWLLSKALPKVYGDKLDLNHGVQPENPLATLIQRIAGTGLPVVPENTDSSTD